MVIASFLFGEGMPLFRKPTMQTGPENVFFFPVVVAVDTFVF